MLYEIMLDGFYVTKPSKRAVRGAVLLAPASMQGRFCRLVGIISTVSKPLRYALRREYVCARGTRGLRSLRCGEFALRVVAHDTCHVSPHVTQIHHSMNVMRHHWLARTPLSTLRG